MDALCLLAAGALAARLPIAAFALEWTHSVEKTRWVERYRVEASALRLVEASVEGSGAGMEPAPGAMFGDGRWTWWPDRALPDLALRHSPFVPPYTLCTEQGCAPLTALVGPAAEDRVVLLRPCPAPR